MTASNLRALLFNSAHSGRRLSRAGRLLTGLALVSCTSASCTDDPLRDLPQVIFWAWERPEDFRGVSADAAAIAYLARTIHIGDGVVKTEPRRNPLRLDDAQIRIAVVRIESAGKAAALSGRETARLQAEILEALDKRSVRALQIDFDARVSERDFYARLLWNLREQTPDDVALTMTALASWCYYESWLDALPVAEAAPMLFRMGRDADRVRLDLQAHRPMRSEKCRLSLGLSTDEPLKDLPSVRRVYLFSPAAWTPERAQMWLEQLQ